MGSRPKTTHSSSSRSFCWRVVSKISSMPTPIGPLGGDLQDRRGLTADGDRRAWPLNGRGTHSCLLCAVVAALEGVGAAWAAQQSVDHFNVLGEASDALLRGPVVESHHRVVERLDASADAQL